MTDRPHLLSWLRRSLVEALATETLVWEQPNQAKYKHAKLNTAAAAAICGRYATTWKTPKERIRHCDICLDLIAQAQAAVGGDEETDTTIELSDKPEGG